MIVSRLDPAGGRCPSLLQADGPTGHIFWVLVRVLQGWEPTLVLRANYWMHLKAALGRILPCSHRDAGDPTTFKNKKGKMLCEVQETLECSEQLMWWCLIFETQRVEHAVQFRCPDFQISASRSAAISLLETPAFLSFCPCNPWFLTSFSLCFSLERDSCYLISRIGMGGEVVKADAA